MSAIFRFIEYVENQGLFEAKDSILLAVSGGQDSVLMAHLFKEAGYQFGIAHCNFGLRGAESQRDEAFVRQLAKQLGVDFYCTHFDTAAFAQKEKISIQMAARQLRYQWFEEVRHQEGYHYIALAQHQNDSVETLLLNLLRGTGIGGLHGIAAKRDKLVRPLLFLNRTEIEEWVAALHLAFVEDSSNLSDKYARNHLRLHVVPQLKVLNENLEETFQKNMARFAEVELLLQNQVAQHRAQLFQHSTEGISIAIAALKALNPQKLLVFELLRPFGFSASVVDEILTSLHKQSGTRFYSSTHQLVIDRGQVLIAPIRSEQYWSIPLHQPGTVALGTEQQFRFSLCDDLHFENNRNKAFVDADRLIFPLLLRNKHEGDKFIPLGMRKTKKLSDFFVDQKIPLSQKQHIPLLLNGNGEIIWVAGMRQDERYKISKSTKKVAIFELLNN